MECKSNFMRSFRLKVWRTIPNMIVHFIDQGEMWTSSGYTIYKSIDNGVSFIRVVDLNVSFPASSLVKVRLFARAFRLGVRVLKKLKDGTLLVVADRKIFRLRDNKWKVTYFFRRGVGPLREGLCEDEKGNCYFGEYFLNNKRNTIVNLFKSRDGGKSWEVICSFSHIRHIHCVQYDPFSKTIWMGTGDRDKECFIGFSEDEGENWTIIGSGSQKFRTTSLLFTEDYVYWGMDTPARQSYIYRYVRKDGKIERLAPVSGPVYHSTILENGVMLFSTGAEGKSEGKSAAWDNRAHIWASLDGVRWEDLISWEKDSWPYILGYGRVFFAHCSKSRVLAFTTQCLKGNDNKSFIGYLFVEDENC